MMCNIEFHEDGRPHIYCKNEGRTKAWDEFCKKHPSCTDCLRLNWFTGDYAGEIKHDTAHVFLGVVLLLGDENEYGCV